MNKEKLVYIKENNGGFTVGQTTFKPHTTYRALTDGGVGYIVYGEPFSKDEFDNLFENAHQRIMRHFEIIGLTKDGKVVSKKEFKERAYDVKYGKGQSSFWTAYFYTHPKECMYRFAPYFSGGTKAQQMTNLYNSFIKLVNGNVDDVDGDGIIEFGNSGLPLGSFGTLRKRFYHSNSFDLV
jgi:hypothetical protein